MNPEVPVVHYGEQAISVEQGESVLDALLRQGVPAKHSCRAGLCQACLMRCNEGEIPPSAQRGLSSGQQAMNYFMACQCHPVATMQVSEVDAESISEAAVVLSREWLGPSILQLKLQTRLDWRAGQYVTLWRDDTIGRSYSIASLPEDGAMECHIKVLADGQFSQWAAASLEVGDEVQVQGPMGLCFYQGQPTQPLLLAAIGTGLAPILGILRDALQSDHQAAIDLVIGAKHQQDFYLVQELESLSDRHESLSIHWLSLDMDESQALHPDGGGSGEIGDIYTFIKERFSSLSGYAIYLCGADSFVRKLKKQCFLQGAAMRDIQSDSFIGGSS